MGFTKFFSQMLHSTVWDLPWNIKGVWITMLLMSDQYGNVTCSVPGLARMATVTIEECETALAVLLSPDPYSTTPDHEGRRIEPIDGGWHILNYTKYREMRDDSVRREQTRAAKRKQRAGMRSSNSDDMSSTTADGHQVLRTVMPMSSPVSQGQPMSAQAEAEAEAEAYTTTGASAPRGVVDGKKKRKPKEKKPEPWMIPHDKAILEAVAKIRAVWPTHSCKQPDGIHFVPATNYGELADRLANLRDFEGADLDALVAIALDHARAFNTQRGVGAPAAHNYFGMRGFNGGPPPWKAAYRNHMTARACGSDGGALLGFDQPEQEKVALRIPPPSPFAHEEHGALS